MINLGHASAPAYKTCDVVVAEGASVADVLDRAAASGCISSWESASYPGFGRYVTCLDGICETPATYWAFYVGGGYSLTGIDATPARDGETYQFTYEQWAVQLPL